MRSSLEKCLGSEFCFPARPHHLRFAPRHSSRGRSKPMRHIGVLITLLSGT
jgi:hypothetical protein